MLRVKIFSWYGILRFLPYSQESGTGFYLEPVETGAYHDTLFLLRFALVSYPHLRIGLPNVFFLWRLIWLKFIMHLFYFTNTNHVLLSDIKSCMLKSLIVCGLYKILLGQQNQGGCNGLDIKHTYRGGRGDKTHVKVTSHYKTRNGVKGVPLRVFARLSLCLWQGFKVPRRILP